jgi:hypothetical protein
MMNIERLKQAEAEFLRRYPGGFYNPEMLEISRRFKMDQMVASAQENFAKSQFNRPEMIVAHMAKIVSRSSMISVFEKPKFRDFVAALSAQDRRLLVHGMESLLHGNEQEGFQQVLDILKSGKLAKWSLMTICQTYYRPEVEVFVKPTTTKWAIEHFELTPLVYHPTPTWAFYSAYRAVINEMKTLVDASLSPANASFTAFLMLSMPEWH